MIQYRLLLGILIIECLSAVSLCAQPNVYRDAVRPHWFADDTQFWYRNRLGRHEYEFVLVDAVNGTRKAAFDHQRIAQALAKIQSKSVDAHRLPIRSIRQLPNGQWELMGNQGTWKLDLNDYSLTPSAATLKQDDSLPSSKRVRPSRRTGVETEIEFLNHRNHAVSVHWIDRQGERKTYAQIQPGSSHAQHTYAGHVWVVTDPDEKVIAVFEATNRPNQAIISHHPAPSPEAQVEAQEEAQEEDRGGAREKRKRFGQSPNGDWAVEAMGHDLWLRNKQDDARRLTHDGTQKNTWRRDAGRERGIHMRYEAPDAPRGEAEIRWSPDSTRFIAIQSRTAPERRVHLIESSPDDQTQPKLHSYPYLKPGDPIPVQQIHLFHAASGQEIPIDSSLFATPFSISDIRWDGNGTSFTFRYNERGHRVYRVLRVNAFTGEVIPIVNEEPKTFFDYAGKLHLRFLDSTHELIWMSERDGWNHLYLIDSITGATKSQITRGDWVVRGVDHIDEEKRQIWFRAGGIHAEQDPYHVHYARVDFDGDNLIVLTEANGTHEIEYSPNREYLIAKWSRVDQAPVHELRSASDGKLICEFERTDTRELDDAGHRLPERFVAKGRNGKTDIYGIVHWPQNFDSSQSYPIVENIYAGPHSAHVPKRFRTRYGHQQELANRGFVVVQIDGMGTSHRSKAFHDVCWKNIADAGFPDRIRWIKALAEKYPCLDTRRVGIYGGSAGGQNSLGALLFHGDFYQVAVADCGCHDNRMDKIWWNELWMSWPIGPHYEAQSNVTQAHRLEGKLLLIVGELDRNVDPASTLQVVSALIKADKDFDFLFVPGGGHGIAESPYGRRRRVDFFVEHLRPPTMIPEESTSQ